MSGLGVALSGGGHRASLFAVGPLLYLAESGKIQTVSSVSSVSGGSITNAYLSAHLDVQDTDLEELKNTLATLSYVISHKGTLWAYVGTWVYLSLLGVLGIATLGAWWLPWAWWLKAITFSAVISVLGIVLGLRGAICGKAFARLLKVNGQPPKLREIPTSVDHVFCSTDLHAGEHVYFSGRFVCSYRFGWGSPGNIDLHDVVQASAALPGAFPPRWFKTATHNFVDSGDADAAKSASMVLVDGGVYDNMADQWTLGVPIRNARWASHNPNLHEPEVIVVVNASGGLNWSAQSRLRTPLIGELLALLRDKDVLYDNGTSVRRRLLVGQLERGEVKGALVHIASTPFAIANHYSGEQDSERGQRARDVLSRLGNTSEEWSEIARDNSAVKTTLSRIDVRTSARLICQGYVLAMVNLHVACGYPMLDIPDEQHFIELIQSGEAQEG